MLDYGYRSACCYAPIKLGTKKIKNTKLKKQIWICVRCGKRDVSLVDYKGKEGTESSQKKGSFTPFVSERNHDED